MPKVTIAEIAQQAGVSKTAVSFAFNKPERLSEATRTHILKIAEELGYAPHPIASNLKTGRTGCIGLLLPQPISIVARNPHNFAFIEGIGEVCHQEGLSLMLVPPLSGNLRRAIVRAAVDGFLTMGLRPFGKTMEVLHQRDAPFVMVDSEALEGIPCVNIDDYGGFYAGMNHLLAGGHRHILILGILSDRAGNFREYVGSLRRRIEGAIDALAGFGLELDGQAVRLVECPVDIESGETAFLMAWQSGFRPTAVLAMGDVLAIGALRAARQLGLSIPSDLSVVGFDDIAACQWMQPRLTSVRQPIVEKGEVAARLLLERIEDPNHARHHVLAVQLIERDSTQALGG